MKSNHHLVINDMGIPFRVRVVFLGEKYGKSHCLTHEDLEPLVEFYDARFPKFDDVLGLGQFVSRYQAKDLTDSHGLNLDGGVDAWYLTKDNMVSVLDWLHDELVL